MPTESVSPALAAFLAQAPLERTAIHALLAEAAAALRPGARVLDAGAGEAPYRELFAHCTYVTQDWTSSVHAGARQADVVASLEELPLEDGSFDGVLCTQVLEHVPVPEAVLAELHRILAPGGRLWLTVPFVGELHEEPYDFYRYTNHALLRLLEGAGFAEVRVEPQSGYYVALAQLMRHCGAATGVELSSGLGRRAVAAGFRGAARVLPRLERLDSRRALPIGWACVARKPGA